MELKAISRRQTVVFLLLVGVSLVCADTSTLNDVEEEYAPYSFGRRLELRTCAPCKQSEHMVMGMQRFSEPRCEAAGAVGAPCREFQEPENKTLSFPGYTLECETVFMQFAPCDVGLVCEDSECKAPAEDERRQQVDSAEFERWAARDEAVRSLRGYSAGYDETADEPVAEEEPLTLRAVRQFVRSNFYFP